MTEPLRGRSILCVGVVCRRDGALLMVQRKNPPGVGKWSLPGGRVEPGETLAEAIARETLEETGLVVEVQRLAGTADLGSGSGDYFKVYDFFAVPRDPTMQPCAATDALDCAFVPLGEVSGLDLVRGLEHWLVRHAILSGVR